MCSINGFIKFSRTEMSIKNQTLIRNIMTKGSDRGRDAFGYIGLNFEGKKLDEFFCLESSANLEHWNQLHPNISILLSNNRAEPTTEFFENKTLNDVQPYSYGNTSIVHNGTISNDKELLEVLNVNLNTKIDSAIIAPVFDKLESFSSDNVKNALTKTLVGSFAVAVYNSKFNKLILATNYKPLNLLYDPEDEVLYFSSLESYLQMADYNNIYSDQKFMEVLPYTALIIDTHTGFIEEVSLYSDDKNLKAVICASSGLDSTVAASWAIKNGYDVTLLHFKYSCRAEQKEIEHIRMIAEELKCPVVEIDVNFMKDSIGNSNLYINNDSEINDTGGGIAGAELAHEWVPARNLIFMSIAAGYCEANGIGNIILGGNLEESSAYADNELIFQKKFGELLPHALNLGNKVNVLTPIANLMKKEIVKLGVDLNAPLHLTWSCYENGEYHCGKCGPCFMRKTAFKMNHIPEVIKYKTDINE